MNEKTIYKFYEYLIDESFEMIEADEFDYSHAKTIYKKFKNHAKMVDVLIKELKTSLKLVEFKNNTDIRDEIEKKLSNLLEIQEKNQRLLQFNISSKQGYYMFIKDVTIILGV